MSNTALLKALLHNGVVVRAALLALVAWAALAADKPKLVPFAVATYALANAVALTKAAAKNASHTK